MKTGFITAGSVSCIAPTRQQTNRALIHLINSGFAHDEISVLFRWKTGLYRRGQATVTSSGLMAMPDWELGAAMSWLADIGSFALPDAGCFVAAGPLSSALGGPTSPLTAGTIMRALNKLGIPARQAGFYVEAVEKGAALVSFLPATFREAEAAKRIFHAVGAQHITVAGCPGPGSGDDPGLENPLLDHARESHG